MKTMENAKIHYLAFFIFLGFIMEIIQSLFRLVPARNDILKKCDSKLAELLLDGLTEDDNPILLFYHMKTKMQ